MTFEKFTIKSQEALQKSAEIASSRQHQAIEPGHLLKAILETDENAVDYLIKKQEVSRQMLETRLDALLESYPKVSGSQPYLSSASNAVLQQAEKELRDFKDEFIAIEHLLLAMVSARDKVGTLLKEVGFGRQELIA